MEIAVSEITVKSAPKNLLLPQDIKKVHPLHNNLTLAAVDHLHLDHLQF